MQMRATRARGERKVATHGHAIKGKYIYILALGSASRLA